MRLGKKKKWYENIKKGQKGFVYSLLNLIYNELHIHKAKYRARWCSPRNKEVKRRNIINNNKSHAIWYMKKQSEKPIKMYNLFENTILIWFTAHNRIRTNTITDSFRLTKSLCFARTHSNDEKLFCGLAKQRNISKCRQIPQARLSYKHKINVFFAGIFRSHSLVRAPLDAVLLFGLLSRQIYYYYAEKWVKCLWQ